MLLILNERMQAWKQWRSGTPLELLDPTVRHSCSRNEVVRCIQMGLLCVQEDPANRPTMATIVLMLNSHSVTLPLPKQPAFLHPSGAKPNKPVVTPRLLQKGVSENFDFHVTLLHHQSI
jgi:hypothetical protein